MMLFQDESSHVRCPSKWSRMGEKNWSQCYLPMAGDYLSHHWRERGFSFGKISFHQESAMLD